MKMHPDDGHTRMSNGDDDDCYCDLYGGSVALQRWQPPQQRQWSSEELHENCCGDVDCLRRRRNDGSRNPDKSLEPILCPGTAASR